MASEESISELKQFILGLNKKVDSFNENFNRVEENLNAAVCEIQADVNNVKNEVDLIQTELQKLRDDHYRIRKRCMAHRARSAQARIQKKELIRQSLDNKILQVREELLLLEKHDRKYNCLVYGIPDKNDENIFETLRTFFEEDLGIESSRIDEIGTANAH